MRVKLGQLSAWKRFPDGISADHDRRIVRAIKQHGPIALVELDANTHEALEKALKEAEKGNVFRRR